ncbi:MAG: glycosyltransferase, partial [Lentisphaerae bacterium]|nr:glycosyltransferase [Lentisphaerota bacterium]
PFNFSRLYNRAIAMVDEELVLMLNNDIEIKEPAWLKSMLQHVYRDGIGAVGCRLVRRDFSIQHASMCFKPTIFSCAMNLFFEEEYYTKVQREVSGVTAACMLMRKSVFNEIGGFDEVNFPIGFSDADLCLRILTAGYKIIYTPFAELYHHESVSRKTHEESYELYNLFKKYVGDTKLIDPHYHTMFSG